MSGITDPAQIVWMVGVTATAITAIVYRATLQHYSKLKVAGRWTLLLGTLLWTIVWVLMRLFG